MRKAKSSEEVSQRSTKRIIETIQGGIIDFSKFKAEPKKTLKNYKDNVINNTERESVNTELSKPQTKAQKTGKQFPCPTNLKLANSKDILKSSKIKKENESASSSHAEKSLSLLKVNKKFPRQKNSGQNQQISETEGSINKGSFKSTNLESLDTLYKIPKTEEHYEEIEKKSPRQGSKPKKVDINKIIKTEDLKIETKSVRPKKSPLKREHIKIEMQNQLLKNEEASFSKSMKFVSPINWQQVVKNLKKMRKDWDAPVDTMGCHKCQDEMASSRDKRYQNLLALMLSSQTKDQVTSAAMQRLIKHGCTVHKISATSDDELGKLIYPVSFWKNKTSYIKKTTEILKAQYDGDIPHKVDELLKLPGVGPKMAHLCMKVAWNEVTGIGVDTHVHRIANRLGWVNTKTPEQTRMSLESWLPKEHWAEINTLLVGFGQTTCISDKPKCGSCMNNPICPSALEFM